MEDPLKPDEIRITSDGSSPLRVREVLAIIVLIGIGILLTIHDVSKSFTDTQSQSQQQPQSQHVLRIPPAPVPPVSKATLSLLEPTQTSVSVSFIGENLDMHFVNGLQEVPSDIQAQAMHINLEAGSIPLHGNHFALTSAPSDVRLGHRRYSRRAPQHFVARQTSRSAGSSAVTNIDTLSGLHEGIFANRQTPVIIHGKNVDIKRGPLNGSDTAVTGMLLNNGDLRGLYSDVCANCMPRGPPQYAFEVENGYRPTRVVYVIGSPKSYTEPDVRGHSIHKTMAIDLGHMSPDQKRKYTEDLNRWRERVRQEFAGHAVDASVTAAFEEELESHAGQEVVKLNSGRLVEPERAVFIEKLPLKQVTPDEELLRYFERLAKEARYIR